MACLVQGIDSPQLNIIKVLSIDLLSSFSLHIKKISNYFDGCKAGVVNSDNCFNPMFNQPSPKASNNAE